MKSLKRMNLLPILVAVAISFTMVQADESAPIPPVALKSITINTRVEGTGQKVVGIKLIVNHTTDLADLKAADFTFSGTTFGWGNAIPAGLDTNPANPSSYRSAQSNPFTAQVTNILVDAESNTVTLDVFGYPNKFYYADSYTLVCSKVAALSFSNTAQIQNDMKFKNSNDLVEVVTTKIADEFSFISVPKVANDISDFNYFLFTPKDASKPRPLILSCHGSGDQMALLANKVVVAWAAPDIQKENPAYVLAPVFPQANPNTATLQDEVIQKTIKLINEMIEKGEVDRDRVYITGKSMGGGNTVKIANRFPDVFAAAMPLCPSNAGEYASVAESLKNMPIWFVVCEEDRLSPVSKGYFSALQDAGNEKAKLTVYSQETVVAYNLDSPHSVECIALEVDTYFKWLFSQKKSTK